ncbi:FAD-dependent thiol oxidase [Meredithblackwellia eburnea MCA 4105]
MVLGPDGKPCKACTAFTSFAGFKKKPTSTSTMAPIPSTADCPVDSLTLGRHTWTFLHTTASYFPIAPSQPQKTHMLSLLRSLPTLYPCHHCADDLGEYMSRPGKDPAAAVERGREGVEKWLCEAHNEVNSKLGKDKFDCGKVGERWRDGPKDGSCD